MPTIPEYDALLKRASRASGQLSAPARSVWGKSDYGRGEEWLPLYVHAIDAAALACRLWHEWLPEATKKTLARGLGMSDEGAVRLYVFLAGIHDVGKATPVFQSKWGAGLAWKPERAGLAVTCGPGSHPTHPLAGEMILKHYLRELGCAFPDAIPSLIGSHHGRFPSRDRLFRDERLRAEMGWNGDSESLWRDTQRELVELALNVAGMTPSDLKSYGDISLSVATQSLLSGLLIMADWIASDQELLSLVPLIEGPSHLNCTWLVSRERSAWSNLHLTPAWSESKTTTKTPSELFAERFSLPPEATPRPVQEMAMRLAQETADSGLMVIEAPMGEGKTEAALLAAEIMASRCGLGGVCVALPTMATTDAMFGRVADWLAHLPHGDGPPQKSIYLAHSKAQLNDRFSGIVRSTRLHKFDVTNEPAPHGDKMSVTDDVIVSEWMYGRKKGMLANFVVCTVDQVLMAALNMKHLALRQLAVANKVVIIDECHAYDLYMRQYLNRLLQWLGYWRVPVILLSATLPLEQRREMTSSYIEGKRLSLSGLDRPEGHPQKALPVWKRIQQSRERQIPSEIAPTQQELEAYPIVTYTDGIEVRSSETSSSGREVEVQVELIPDSIDDLACLMKELLSQGGCAGIICDTVGRAQVTYCAMREAFGPGAVHLDHSRFIDMDRMENERELRDSLGPSATRGNGRRPDLSVVVGTQVLEQSLDIDFDVLVTDIAPVDLVLQRMGRTHRHRRGEGESDRPARLRSARCYVRGVESIGPGGPSFARGLTSVYDKASLMVSLGMLGLLEDGSEGFLSLPHSISRLVRAAYGPEREKVLPKGWAESYEQAAESKRRLDGEKVRRAKACLINSLKDLAEQVGPTASLLDLAATSHVLDGVGADDKGQQTVRDAQESLEVLLVEEISEGEGISLLPWVAQGADTGQELPLVEEPDPATSIRLANCAVRLPLSICPLDRLDECIEELEDRCWCYVGAWQESPWLAGRLLLPMRQAGDGSFETELMGQHIIYTKELGLAVS